MRGVSKNPPIRRLAFVANESKEGAAALAKELMSQAKSLGSEIAYTARFPIEEGFLEGSDACCVIGGDGTFLSVAAESARRQVPVIGVNRGTLGFLTTYAADEIAELLPDILRGGYRLSYRSMLRCWSPGGSSDLALNDVVVKNAEPSRTLMARVFADGKRVTAYLCDGLIFSTPTGSTAYTLSAGGPLIHPAAPAVALTPICPHTLSNRSIIFPETVELQVECARKSEMRVAVDGQRHLSTLEDGRIRIRLAEERLPVAQRLDYEHFAVVRKKLNWDGGYAANT